MKFLRLGTRKSALARAQADWVIKKLGETFPATKIELILITTAGDRLQAEPSPSPLPKGRGPTALAFSLQGDQAQPNPYSAPSPGSLREGGRRPDEGVNLKALFTKEIEEALLERRIDLAVHSLKDMSAILPSGLVIGAVTEREDPRDVWISKSRVPFKDIPKNATIGTGAIRRQAQLKRIFPNAKLVAIRGNVDTRLQKLSEGSLDGLILALAGLKRLGREKVVTDILETDVLLPAVGQGCLGIQVREKDADIAPFLKALDHPSSHSAAKAERAFLKTLGGSCQTPIAGHASIESGELTMRGLVISPDGLQVIRAKENGRPFDAEGIGKRLAEKLLEAGADKILSA